MRSPQRATLGFRPNRVEGMKGAFFCQVTAGNGANLAREPLPSIT